jgi:hypothetical protein
MMPWLRRYVVTEFRARDSKPLPRPLQSHSRAAEARLMSRGYAGTIARSRTATRIARSAPRRFPGICTDRKFNKQVAWSEQCGTVADRNVRRRVNRAETDGNSLAARLHERCSEKAEGGQPAPDLKGSDHAVASRAEAV